MSAAGDMTVDNTDDSVISFVLDAVADVNSLPTYGAACAGASKFTATVRNWKGTAAATDITAGNCVITLAASTSIVAGTTGEDASLGAISMTAALKFN